jgi:hypothetical protein
MRMSDTGAGAPTVCANSEDPQLLDQPPDLAHGGVVAVGHRGRRARAHQQWLLAMHGEAPAA